MTIICAWAAIHPNIQKDLSRQRSEDFVSDRSTRDLTSSSEYVHETRSVYDKASWGIRKSLKA